MVGVVLTLGASLAAYAQDISKIKVPPGFRIAIFARLPSAPRFMLFTPEGNLLVSLMNAGQIAVVNPQGEVSTFATGLRRPHGMALRGRDLYVAEENQVRAYRNMNAGGSEVLVQGLPTGGHITRTVGFGLDDKMYVSIGSSCNLCTEQDQRRAAIVRYNPDGTGQEIFARGLRNSVGFRWHPQTHELWATDNGGDNFGDDEPPEEINIVRQGVDYGWPYCWGDRQITPERLFRGGTAERCAPTVPPAVQMQAHSAPLGLDFYTGTQFPNDYRNDAFVAFHGSWNRSVPTGYKIVRVGAKNGVPGAVEDFATGWLEGGGFSGRPVDVLTGPDGALYVSDDHARVIYRVTYEGALLNAGGITNAASFSASIAAAPGGLISIFGRNLFVGTFRAASLPLLPSIDGLAVTIGGQPAPLLYASATQINVQVPPGMAGTATLVVSTNNGSDSAAITVEEAAPGLFSLDGTGSGAGAIRNFTRGAVVSAASPARAGDALEIYATGLGAVSEELPAGSPAPLDRLLTTRAIPTVAIVGVQAEVLFSGLAPGYAGLYQVNVRVPSGVTAGPAVPVALSIAGRTSNTVTIALQ